MHKNSSPIIWTPLLEMFFLNFKLCDIEDGLWKFEHGSLENLLEYNMDLRDDKDD